MGTYPLYVGLADELFPLAHGAKISSYPNSTSLARRIGFEDEGPLVFTGIDGHIVGTG